MTRRVAKKVLRLDCDGLWSTEVYYGEVKKLLWSRANAVMQRLGRRGFAPRNKWCPYVDHPRRMAPW